MKRCPNCKAENFDDEIECRKCRKLFVEKRGRLRGCLSMIVSTIIFIVSLCFVISDYIDDHTRHGHYNPIEDPAHAPSLIFALLSGVWTWRNLTRRR